MRIILITQGLSPIFQLLRNLNGHDLVGVIEDAPRKPVRLSKWQRLFRNGRFKPTLGKICASSRLPYIVHGKSNKEAVAEWVGKLAPDLIIVYSMSRLLSASIFEIPRYGTINIHPGILPQYKGKDPWSMLYRNFDLNPGVTIHFVDRGEDTGDLIKHERYPLKVGTPLEEAMDLSVSLACNMLKDTIEDFVKGNIVRVPQSRDNFTSVVDLNGNCTDVDWPNWSTERVWHYLRGMQTYGLPIVLPPLKGLLKFADWKIGEMVDQTGKEPKHRLGAIERIGTRWLLQCSDGQIEMVSFFRIKSVIKRILM